MTEDMRWPPCPWANLIHDMVCRRLCGPCDGMSGELFPCCYCVEADKKPKVIVYDVDFSGEMSAGLRPYTDRIRVEVESGEPGGDAEGEDSFQAHMLRAIREWYDGAGVEMIRMDA